MKKIVAIIQARMSSSRLSNKVLLNLCGKPVVEQVFNQLSFSKLINEIVLATSEDRSDDPLENWARLANYKFFRGSLNNVLERFYDAARFFSADIIVRITADCPLIDPSVVDDVIKGFLCGNFDYYSNINPPSFPDGLDTEVFSFDTLEKAFRNADLQSEIEHVTPYIRNHPDLFRIGNLNFEKKFDHLRWTLDNQEDFEFISIIYDELYKKKSFIKFKEVLKFLEKNKELMNINSHIERNEGFSKSLKSDKKIR